METPASLLDRLRRPEEPDAWRRFVELYTPLIYSWGRGAGLQPADAADLVQDVLVVLLRKLPAFEYDHGQSFRAWLRTVVLNKWRDRCRLLVTRPAGSLGNPEEIAEPASDSFTEVEYRKQLVARALELMQAEFQPTTWKACWEFVVNARSAADVARELKISENAVYIAKSRVLRRLREELKGQLD